VETVISPPHSHRSAAADARAAFFSTAIANSSQPFASGYADGRLMFANDAFAKLTGYSHEELNSLTWAVDLTPLEWREVEAEVLATLRRTAEPQVYEKEYVRKDGSRVPVEVNVHLHRDEQGSTAYYYAFVTDISSRRATQAERDRAIQQLRDSEERFRRIFRFAPTGIAIADSQGKLVHCNPAFEQIVGYSQEELKEIVFGDIVHPEDREENLALAGRLRRGEIPHFTVENRYVRKDGQPVWVHKIVAFLPGLHGERDLLALVTDVTERRQYDETLRRAKETAEAANEAKDKFLAMLSHELRTPLTPVMATLNLWQASGTLPVELKTDVDMMRRNIDLEARIIDDLLDLTRIRRGLLTMTSEPVDVHSTIDLLLTITRSDIVGKRLNLRVELRAERHIVSTDAARLQQVLWNVLRNAINYSEEQGAITISSSNDADMLVVQIADAGIGMSPEMLERVFKPFEQADRARSARYGGLGLGMAISHALIEQMNGTLTAASEGVGKGATFTIRLPVAPDAAKPRTETRAEYSPHKCRILIVEDHADTARALSRLLAIRSHEATIAGTLAEAAEKLRTCEFDLLLCDVGLPDGTGYDFVESLRSNGNDMPAIAVTGFGMSADIDRALHAGFDAHLTKPIQLHKVESAMTEVLGKHRQQQS
jgi:two-component system, chemotaxis family, CheB/CheR fusion protein